MSYILITAKCEEVNESSYINQSTGEIVSKIQLSLVVPSMRERVLCELPLDKAPKPDLLDRWELEESWLVVSTDGMRALAFERSNARAGEKPVSALVVFQGADVREATPEERKQLQEARKTQKIQAKQRRAQRQAEKQAARRRRCGFNSSGSVATQRAGSHAPRRSPAHARCPPWVGRATRYPHTSRKAGTTARYGPGRLHQRRRSPFAHATGGRRL